MDTSRRFPAILAYVPVLGWLYVLLAERKNRFAMFHARQSVGIILFMLVVAVVWAVAAWLISWLPYGIILANISFAIVAASWVFGVFTWVAGVLNAVRGRVAFLPIFGERANRLPL